MIKLAALSAMTMVIASTTSAQSTVDRVRRHNGVDSGKITGTTNVLAKNAAERMAINSVVQGSAADLIMIAIMTVTALPMALRWQWMMAAQGMHDTFRWLTAKGEIPLPHFMIPPQMRTKDAVVISLKSRSCAVDDAISMSLQALDWLVQRNCEQFFFKYCSTFDSTSKGNIGPVTEALLAFTGSSFTIACPAFPATPATELMLIIRPPTPPLSRIKLLAAALNPDPNPNKGGSLLALSGDSALIAAS